MVDRRIGGVVGKGTGEVGVDYFVWDAVERCG